MLGRLKPQHALVLHEIAQDFATALFGEDVLGNVRKHGAVERRNCDSVAGAGIFAAPREAAAVVVAVRLAAGIELAGAFQLTRAAAASATQQPGDQQWARRQPT